jgi:hypothetical protein
LIPTGGDPRKLYALILDRNRRLLEMASIRLGKGGSDDLRNGLLGGVDIHQDVVSGLNPTGGDPRKLYALILDRNRRLLDGASIRLGKGGSDDLLHCLLGATDIHQDDASVLIPTGGDPMKLYALILDKNRRLLKWASMRLGNGGSDDLRNWLLSAPDTHQDDSSGAFPTKEGQSTHYAMILEGHGRLLERALIRLDHGDFDDHQNWLLGGADIHEDVVSGLNTTGGDLR